MTGYTIHLMRHGAPADPTRLLGHVDPPSTLRGLEDCIAKAGSLHFDTVVGSDLRRASAAARAIAAGRGLSCRTDMALREMDFGRWDGLPPEAIEAAALADFRHDPQGSPPPGGERWSVLIERVCKALRALPARDTLVVTHGGAMRAALAGLCGFTYPQTWAFDLPYTAVLSMRMWTSCPGFAQVVGLKR